MKHFLTVIVPEEKAVKYALKGEVISLGRAEDNAISLEVQAVSSHHLEIHKTDTGYRLIDLDSTNGTTANGTHITEHQLANGDDLVIGTAVRAQYAAVADESTAATAPAQPLKPRVVEQSVPPVSPTVVLKKPSAAASSPVAPAAKRPSQPVKPPSGIRVRKMTPPGVEVPEETPTMPMATPVDPSPADPDESTAGKDEEDDRNAAPKLKIPGQGGRPRKLNLG